MKSTTRKALAAFGGILLAAEIGTAGFAWNTQRALATEFRALRDASVEGLNAQQLRRPPDQPAEAAALTASPSLTEQHELERLRRRRDNLGARPPGVIDAQMLPVADVGRSTPDGAARTLAWALASGDLAAAGRFVVYADDTPENREAYMSNFSPAVQARYPTPEQVAIAFSFAEALNDPPVSLQVVSSHSYHVGAHTVTTWVRHASGREGRMVLPLQEQSGQWSLAAIPLTGPRNGAEQARSRIDAGTGDILPPRK